MDIKELKKHYLVLMCVCVHVHECVCVCVLGRNLPAHLIYSKKPGAWEAEMTFSRSQAAWEPVLLLIFHCLLPALQWPVLSETLTIPASPHIIQWRTGTNLL